jgi:hypothetical protein
MRLLEGVQDRLGFAVFVSAIPRITRVVLTHSPPFGLHRKVVHNDRNPDHFARVQLARSIHKETKSGKRGDVDSGAATIFLLTELVHLRHDEPYPVLSAPTLDHFSGIRT